MWDLLQRVIAAQPSFTEEQALVVEQQIRRDYGGERILIAAAKVKGKPRREHIARELAGKPAHSIDIDCTARQHGVSRATIYRLLNRKG